MRGIFLEGENEIKIQSFNRLLSRRVAEDLTVASALLVLLHALSTCLVGFSSLEPNCNEKCLVHDLSPIHGSEPQNGYLLNNSSVPSDLVSH